MNRPAAWCTERLMCAAAVAAVFGASICLADAAWIQAKAVLAQVLIGAAWRRAQAGAVDVKPWSWADTGPVARLTIGKGAGSRELYVLEGASGRNLAFGPVHDAASVAPGERGNSVIDGHRDTHFAVLRDLRIGDAVGIETPAGKRAQFTVTNVDVVDSRRSRIALSSDVPRLTLVTCYPFDAVVPGGPLRWVVTADLKRDAPFARSSRPRS